MQKFGSLWKLPDRQSSFPWSVMDRMKRSCKRWSRSTTGMEKGQGEMGGRRKAVKREVIGAKTNEENKVIEPKRMESRSEM